MPCRIWTCLDCHTTTREAEPRHDCLDATRHSAICRNILHLASTCQTPTALSSRALTNLSSLSRDMPRKTLTALPNLVLTRLATTNLNKPWLPELTPRRRSRTDLAKPRLPSPARARQNSPRHNLHRLDCRASPNATAPRLTVPKHDCRDIPCIDMTRPALTRPARMNHTVPRLPYRNRPRHDMTNHVKPCLDCPAKPSLTLSHLSRTHLARTCHNCLTSQSRHDTFQKCRLSQVSIHQRQHQRHPR